MPSNDEFFDKPTQPSVRPLLRKPWYRRWWGVLLISFLTFFLVLGIAIAFYVGNVVYQLSTGLVTPDQIFGGSAVVNQPDGSRVTYATEDDPSFGPKDAKVTIVEFSDFQCPFCRQVFPVVKEILNEYGDQIHFVYRDFPLTDIHALAKTIPARVHTHRPRLRSKPMDEYQ